MPCVLGNIEAGLFPRDPDFATKAGPILDLYGRVWESPPLGADDFVISADEKTSIQARRRNNRRCRPLRTVLPPESLGHEKLFLARQAQEKALSLATEGGQGYFAYPHFLPRVSGRSVLVYSVGYMNPSLMVHDLKSGKLKVLGKGFAPVYADPGYLLFTDPGALGLWAMPFSLSGLKSSGEAFRVAASGMHPSVSGEGTLAYLETPFEQLAWFDRSGDRGNPVGEPAQGIYYPAVSPDGRRVAMETMENANLDVWVLDLDQGSRTRLSSDVATDMIPAWSPAGDEVVYGSYRSGSIDIWMRKADGGTGERMIFGTGRSERVSDWSRDGKYMLYSALDSSGRSDLWYLAHDGSGEWAPQPFLESPADERVGKFSPDGRYVAYLSDESGRMGLYVRSFPEGRRKWTISSNGATQPRWSRDGKEIFYVENGTLFATPVVTASEFSAGAPVRLFSHPMLTREEMEPHYDLSSDRQRVLMPETVGGNELLIHVVQNWLAAFPGH